MRSLQKLEENRIDDLTIRLDIPHCATSQVKINEIYCPDIYQTKGKCERYVKRSIALNQEIPVEMKEKLKDNIDRGYYYTTFKVNGKDYLFENSNVSKYFRYCAQNNELPSLSVHFLYTSNIRK